MVADIVALLDHLKIKRSVIIGSSMGGVLGQMLCFMHPSRVRALILVGTLAKAIWLGHAQQYVRRILRRGPDKGVREWFAPKAKKRNIDFALHEARKTSRHFGVGVVLANSSWDIRDKLPTIRAPTLIIVGKEDKRTTPVTESREMHSLIKDSEMKIVSGAGHLVMLDRPDVFNNLMLSYLEKKGI